MKNIVSIALLAFLFLSCNSNNKKENEKELTDSKIILKIEDLSISERDIDYKVAIEKVYGNNSINRLQACVMLTNEMIEYALLRKQNLDILAYELQELKNHTFASSKAPELLTQIQNIFEEDTNSLNQLFFRPIVVTQKLNQYFYLKKEFHVLPIGAIQKAFQQAQTGSSYELIASDSLLQYVVDTITAEQGIFQIANSLELNQIYPEIIESDYSFSILKVINKHAEKITIETVSVAKNDLQKWMQTEINNLNMPIYDEMLFKDLKIQYPNLNWVKNLINN
ncbi:MAG: hypothetical protein HN921_07770 [Bacteroidetes bacterium]|nr:hypothetical protein [Bacteroidota bacterium]MBT3423174.1 hypothetical protein [Bacteroidota bacterium]MBT3935388.1 hypothetical protein [Bacteroidota bacterium]MBT4728598.1 hypothetical protein [Bacteroidota bacterium]MBT4969781.1 hypothetical protein [Bacteroidota bacterium]